MKRSTERILTTHVGSLVRPLGLVEFMRAKENGQAYDQEELAACVRSSVKDVVQKQVEAGVDILSDGEYGKPSFSGYVNERLSGFERRPRDPNESPLLNWGRDRKLFREFYEAYDRATGSASGAPVVCSGPIAYQGQAAVQRDIDTFKAALAGEHVEEAFIPAVGPGTIELQRRNEYYPTDEAYLFAIAEAMREEYRAIVDAGFLLQIDDPRLVTYYVANPGLSIEQCRKWAELRVEVLNHALRDIPPDKVRFHTCYSINIGPRVHDMPLKDIVDILLKVNAGAYSFEASNPRHEHEYHVWETVRLPEGKAIIPGVISHTTNLVEHPELIAERIVRFARAVGREHVIAGADCGFSAQARREPDIHPSVVWAKFEALAEGARLATK